MALIITFLIITLAVGAALLLLTDLALWQALLICLPVYLLLHVVYLGTLYLVALTVDRSKPLEKQSAICRLGAQTVLGLVCGYCNIHARLGGTEKLPRDGRFLLVCNHRSSFDPCVGVDKLRKWNVEYISKPSVLKIPVIGRIAYAAGFLPIDRENNREALKTILQAADYLKRGLCSMAVYPEGTRSRDGNMLPFHPGCFKIAQRANVPLVIAAIRGTENTMKNLPFKRTNVYMQILELVPAEQVKAMSTGQLAAHSREVMEKWLAETGERT